MPYNIKMRGVWYILEAIISIILILTFLLVIRNTALIAPQQDVSLTGYSLLRGLDDRGLLRNYTVNGDYEAINSSIRYYVYNHTVEICDYSGSCSGMKPNTTNVYVSSYIISGDNEYNPYEVKLYLY